MKVRLFKGPPVVNVQQSTQLLFRLAKKVSLSEYT